MYFVIRTPDLDRARAFYSAVFGWTYRADNHIEGSSPVGGIAVGEPRTDLYFEVPDAAAAASRLRALGGTAPDPAESASGWSFVAEGGRLALWQPGAGYADSDPKCAEGDLFYYVVPVADDATRDRYAAVLGWELTPGSHEGGWNITNSVPPGGVFVDHTGRPDLYFRVADVEQAAQRVRAAGGTAGDVQPNSVGSHAACRDDQGVSFSIGSLHQA